MELSANDLWAGFVAHCGERAPHPDLMLGYAQRIAGNSSTGLFEPRVGTILAILRTRMACDRPVQPADVARARALLDAAD